MDTKNFNDKPYNLISVSGSYPTFDHLVQKSMKSKILILTAAFAGLASAGEAPQPESVETAHICDLMKSIGKVYENSENPYIQEVKFYGRAQWQYGYTDGEGLEGDKFSDNYTELRRLRAGAQVRLFNKIKVKGSVNLEQGGTGQHRFGLQSLDTASVTYDAGSVFGLDDLNISYGRHKVTVSAESHESSRKLKTVERSNIGNFFTSGKRATGFTVSAEKFETEFNLGVYSTDEGDYLGSWNTGEAYYLGVERGAWNADFIYNDVDVSAGVATEDDLFDYRWATSLAYEAQYGRWNVLLNGVYGEDLSNQEVYGVVLMPSTFLIEDKLEAVARYQYAASEGDNLSLTKRYAGKAGDVEKGRKGSENHTVYTGLNYYMCGHRAKVQAGVEYEKLERENRETADAVTVWAAFRMYF